MMFYNFFWQRISSRQNVFQFHPTERANNVSVVQPYMSISFEKLSLNMACVDFDLNLNIVLKFESTVKLILVQT